MKLIKVKLLGELGRKFGREFTLMAQSASHVIHALGVQLRGFSAHLYQSSDRGVDYKVITDDPDGLGADELGFPVCDRLIIAPIIRGRSAFGKILAGVALIGAALLIGPGVGFLGVAWGSTFMGLGASLVFGGIAQMLTSNSNTSARESKRNESYLFDQASSVGSQGLPVPVLYGDRFITGLSIISSGISTQDVSL